MSWQGASFSLCGPRSAAADQREISCDNGSAHCVRLLHDQSDLRPWTLSVGTARNGPCRVALRCVSAHGPLQKCIW